MLARDIVPRDPYYDNYYYNDGPWWSGNRRRRSFGPRYNSYSSYYDYYYPGYYGEERYSRDGTGGDYRWYDMNKRD